MSLVEAVDLVLKWFRISDMCLYLYFLFVYFRSLYFLNIRIHRRMLVIGIFF